MSVHENGAAGPVLRTSVQERPSAMHRAWRAMRHARWPMFAVGFLIVASIAAAIGPLLTPFDPNRQNLLLRLADNLDESTHAELANLLDSQRRAAALKADPTIGIPHEEAFSRARKAFGKCSELSTIRSFPTI